MYITDVPQQNNTYSKVYDEFAGVDFSSAPTQVDERRSPDAVNMTADINGFPRKRFGYKTVVNMGERINGMFEYVSPEAIKTMIVHCGKNIYALNSKSEIYFPAEGDVGTTVAVFPEDAEKTLLYSDAADNVSRGFMYMGILYILDGKKMLVYNGETLAPVEDSAYVPTTAISASPSGGGESFEPINLLSDKRINCFCGTASDTVYQLDAINITSVDKCEKMTGSGKWSNITSYTYSTSSGKVTFASAPGVSPVTGEDNVRITFTKTNEEYKNRINKCKIFGIFGMGNDLRIFLSGNVNFPNYDRHSYYGRGDYFPDINYSVIGADSSAVMGYLKQYDEMIIVKQKQANDVGIYSRSAITDEDGRCVFTVKQGVSGIGAVSCDCFANLCDDNLFLCQDGVFGLDTSSITYQRSATVRSFYVNGRLCSEPDLKYAFCAVGDGKYYLFVNGRVYIADSKQRNTVNKTGFGYEWYYWDNIPARRAMFYENRLYFGTPDGRICKLMQESDGASAYSDDGEPIYACWTTKFDDLGDITKYKTICKRGVGVLAMPYEANSGRIYYITEKEKQAGEYSMATLVDLNNIDFDDFTFGLASRPTFIPVNSKEKKVKMISVKVENGNLNEGFGIFKIALSYTTDKNIK